MGGTKKKIGKQRRDKAYWSAKEIGYRSRASFKLVQLNRKFEFLQKSRVCLDLCAAPGSWMQVAKEHMPVSSLIVGVDLVPIKPIAGCIVMQNDITTDKCRSDIKKELQTWKADLVLHDGAGNVGKNWIHDAYQQSLLTLHAFKLATEFLVKGGTFVTKVFRSKDYQSLVWVFNQLFRKVHSTKPAASRNESAEIFVVCQGYKAPDKIDPRFLDARHVFSEVEGDGADGSDEAKDRELLNPERKKKAPAEGYETGATLLYKKAKASEFILDDKPIHVLNNYHEIILDEPRIYKHDKTTKEVVECCKDLKVLGMKELRLLKKWREVLKAEFEAIAKSEAEKKKEAAGGAEKPTEKPESDLEDEELEDLDTQIEKLHEEERKVAKRIKKRSLKEKRKIAEKIDLKMIIPGDEGPTMEEEGLFRIKDLKTLSDLEIVTEQEPETVAESGEEDDDEDPNARKKTKMVKYSKESGQIDKAGLWYKESDSEAEESEDSDEEMGTLGLEVDDEELLGVTADDEERYDNFDSNPLVLDLDESSRDVKRKRKADLWFDRDVFKGIEEDENLAEADIECSIRELKKQGGDVVSKKRKVADVAKKSSKDQTKNGKDSSSDDSSTDGEDDDDSGSEFDVEESYRDAKRQKKTKEKDGFEVVPKEKVAKTKKKKSVTLTPEELALGQEMIMSKKRKRDVIDKGWNRYMYNDRDEDLPDWFVKEEEIHMRPRPEVDPAVVEHYRKQQRELNVKTIKKVVEAKARKKRRMVKKLDRAKKKAAVLMDNPDLGGREKASEIQKLYRKAASSQKKEVAYVVAKKSAAGKRAVRPAGVKGPYKQVDPRMKKDTIKKRGNATSKKMQKRRMKGKHTRPTRP